MFSSNIGETSNFNFDNITDLVDIPIQRHSFWSISSGPWRNPLRIANSLPRFLHSIRNRRHNQTTRNKGQRHQPSNSTLSRTPRNHIPTHIYTLSLQQQLTTID